MSTEPRGCVPCQVHISSAESHIGNTQARQDPEGASQLPPASDNACVTRPRQGRRIFPGLKAAETLGVCL